MSSKGVRELLSSNRRSIPASISRTGRDLPREIILEAHRHVVLICDSGSRVGSIIRVIEAQKGSEDGILDRVKADLVKIVRRYSSPPTRCGRWSER